MEKKTFDAGITARCNRCHQASELPEAVEAVKENEQAWRLQGFATLTCGHMDTHWVFEADLEQ